MSLRDYIYQQRELQRQAAERRRFEMETQERERQQQMANNPAIRIPMQSEFERRAGVMPPGYEGTRNRETGELLAQYRMDPYAGRAQQALAEQAFAEGESPWLKLQMQQQRMGEEDQRGAAQRASQQALSQAAGTLARTGGLSSGARSSLARQGARDLMTSRQQISRQGMGERLGLQAQDLGRREGLVKSFADAESAAKQADIGQLTGDITRSAAFDVNRYNEMMRAWAAQQSADATRASGGGGKK